MRLQRLQRLEADPRHCQMFRCVPAKKPVTHLAIVNEAGAVVAPRDARTHSVTHHTKDP